MPDIRGSFAVTKVRLVHHNINYAMLFTDDRVILVKAGGPPLAGRALEGTNDLGSISADDLVKTDKDNVVLFYRHISGIRMRKSSMGHNGARSGVIDFEILGKKRSTFDILKGQDYEKCRSVVSAVMPDKLR